MRATHFLLCITALFFGCSLTKQVPVQSKETFTFDYVPQDNAKPGSAGILISLIKPYYATAFTSGNTELFKSFREALGGDIEELILAKGFTLKGPYAGFGEMIFDDKKRTDIAIQIEIAPEFTSSEGSWQMHPSILGANYTTYTYSGKVSLVGKINLTGVEPLTNERIWSKSVSIPNVENIQIETSGRYNSPLGGDKILQDPSVYNAVGKALRSQYAGIMEKIEAHFNPEEFTSLKAQIKELKSKKGY